MKKISVLILFFSIYSSYVNAQQSDNVHRLSFYEFGIYYANGSTSSISTNSSSPIGNTIGIVTNLNPTYNNYEETDPFRLGWSANVAVAWNFTNQKAARDNLDIGMWMSKLLNKNLEFGLQYSFLGVYGYQNISFFGSSAQAAVRVTDFQLTYSREGEGVFTGFISSKNAGFNTNSVSLKYFLGKKLFVASRYTTYRLNKEYTLALGISSL